MKGFSWLPIFLLAFCEPQLVKGCPSDDLIHPCQCKKNELDCSDIDNKKELRKALSSGFQEPVEFNLLVISGSPISALTSDVFRPIKSEAFSINNNANLTYIDEDAFSGSEDFIKSLKMRENNIQGEDIFVAMSKMRGLSSVDLHHNGLTSVPVRALKSMKDLTEVDLSENRIIRLGREAFADCPKLTTVDLSNNKLRILPGRLLAEDSLVVVTPTVTLDLSFNDIDEIEPDALEGIEKGIDIYFDNNKLQILEREVFKPLLDKQMTKPGMNMIYVTDNPFFCDCRMQWILDNPRYFDHIFPICSNTKNSLYSYMHSPIELGQCLL